MNGLLAVEHADEVLVELGVGLGHLVGRPLLEALAGLEADLALVPQLLEQGGGLVGVLQILQDIVSRSFRI